MCRLHFVKNKSNSFILCLPIVRYIVIKSVLSQIFFYYLDLVKGYNDVLHNAVTSCLYQYCKYIRYHNTIIEAIYVNII